MEKLERAQLDHIEYLLAQSAQGIHFLFDHKAIAKILSKPVDGDDFFTFENINKVQAILTEFIQKTTIRAKREYLSSLNAETYELLIRTYFNIVENTVFKASKYRH